MNMQIQETTEKKLAAAQTEVFESGNEMVAMAAAQINYHIMGYFPITPSTEIAQYLDMMRTRGEHDIKLIPADGEHGSAGTCYGAAGRSTGIQCYQREWFPVYDRTASCAGGHTFPDGHESGDACGQRTAGYSR